MDQELLYAKLNEGAKPPVRKHAGDAGVDVFAADDIEIPPFSAGIVPTGLSFDIAQGTMLLAKPKGGSNFIIGAGVIDAGYQGEIKIKVINYSPLPLVIQVGTPVAQLVQVVIFTDPLREVPLGELYQQESERGASGGINNQ
jgi:dUTP pyrophosphatase